jgi:hypothetical protein
MDSIAGRKEETDWNKMQAKTLSETAKTSGVHSGGA